VGQPNAVGAVADAVIRARSGVRNPRRPIGSFLFVGPTGVGKTELAMALADALFDSADCVLRFDMSEFQDGHTVARLIGAPPGYLGYDEGGQLTERVRRNPYAVVLFDEIEKAHGDVLTTLLGVLDDGAISDSHGRTVDFRNTVVIMTSNAGAHPGPGEAAPDAGQLEAALRAHLSREFLARVDDIIVFHPLKAAELERIIDILFGELRDRLSDIDFRLELVVDARRTLARAALGAHEGARILRRLISHEVETRIGRALLGEPPPEPGSTVVVSAPDGRIEVRLVPESGQVAADRPRGGRDGAGQHQCHADPERRHPAGALASPDELAEFDTGELS
jgi:ATP-dependent Clp protease ATP-binding subunit ClpB